MPVKFGTLEVGRADYQIFPPSSLDSIVLGVNLRDEQDYGDLEAFARELFNPEGPGQLQPGVVRKSPDNNPVLVAGFRRLRAIRLGNSDPTIRTFPTGVVAPLGFKAVTIRCNEDEALLYNLAENRHRKDLSPISLAKAARYLADHKGWNNKQIADAMNVSNHYVADLLHYLDLPESARLALHTALVPETLAKAFKGLPEHEIVEVVKEVEQGKTTPVQARRKVEQTKRERGVRAGRTLGDFTTELRELVGPNKNKPQSELAWDLLAYCNGDHADPLHKILAQYDLTQEVKERVVRESKERVELRHGLTDAYADIEFLLGWIGDSLGADYRQQVVERLEEVRAERGENGGSGGGGGHEHAQAEEEAE